ncbi:circularly permuted type 2 ATP-grasp protein [Nocardia stercoris]|uniref:DUF403 domain-containing protein n=1 Tax=Nocardia stercoris TaxID=2483361 RepID=A0A3M2LB33_9NOCA|nr:circularly permuted type 2 ATP-grasp protein [Nocardia stercoris]RMI33930.1 hypothetical protein EBN03_05535 [Nocardia stercoris]
MTHDTVRGKRAQAEAEFRRYRADAESSGDYDELVDPTGRVRPMWSELSHDFVTQGAAALNRIDSRVRRIIEDDGITYTETGVATPNGVAVPAAPTPWRLDPVPLLVSAEDWTGLEAGLVQRARLLDEVLTDVYGPRRLLRSGQLPPQIVFGSTGYLRAAHGITVPGRHQLFLLGCDVSRWADGTFRVLTDWAQAPSGAGYALADRRVVSTAVPDAFEGAVPRPLTPFARAMRLMLIEAAPEAGDDADPVVVVLSPGVMSETAFDQAYLASVLGFPLVESADLVVRDGCLWMRSLGTLRRVDVVLRRLDAEFADPLDLRADSQLGVVGLVEVLRRGAVTVVNTLGSGLLESPALAAFLPELSRTVLDEELKLQGAPAYWCGDDRARGKVLADLPKLIVRSAVDGTTYYGPALAAAEREELAARIESHGWQWVGQEPPEFSVAPALSEGTGLVAAPVGVRLFALAGRVGYRAMPGGLGHQYLREPGTPVVSSPGRPMIPVAAKDVWVRMAPTTVAAVPAETQPEERIRIPSTVPVVEALSSPRVLDDLFWMGRYAERAENSTRLLAAIHSQSQDYRYRPWLEGAAAVPVLMAALSRVTGTVLPYEHPNSGVSPESPVPQQQPPRIDPDLIMPAGGYPDSAADSAGSSADGAAEPNEVPPPQPQDGIVPPQGTTAAQAGAAQQGTAAAPGGAASDEAAAQGRAAAPGEAKGVAASRGEAEGAAASRGEAGDTAASRGGAGDTAASRGGAETAAPQGAADGVAAPQGAADGAAASRGEAAGAAAPGAADGAAALQGAAAASPEPTEPAAAQPDSLEPPQPQVVGATAAGYDYLVRVTLDRELPGSVAFAIEHYAANARAVRDQLSQDTWMILSAVDRARQAFSAAGRDMEAELSVVHSAILVALLSLSGVDAESMVRDIGWYVSDIGKRIERGLSITALLSSVFEHTYPEEVEGKVTEGVLRATESSVSYRRRHRDSVRVAAVASLLLFDEANPRSLAYQLDRLHTDLNALPGNSGSSRPQRLLADARRLLRRLDPADLEATDADGRRTDLVELLDGVHLRLRKLADSFQASRLAGPGATQPLWGSTQVVP